MTMQEAIQQRQSVRTYQSESLQPDLLEKINSIISGPKTASGKTPFGSVPRFQLLDLSEMPEEERGKLGTYGFIKGAEYFIAGSVSIPQTEDSDAAGIMTDFGFVFEGIILELTRLGLGTCWLGGTFKRKDLSEMLKLGEDEIIPAIIPVGIPAERQSLKAKFIRFAAGSKNRKPLDELVFQAAGSEKPDRNDGKIGKALESVRLAPSASNKQPWRIVISGSGETAGTYHFFIQRNKGYGMFGEYIDLQRVDSGIALSHFAETAEELGIAGTWEDRNRAAADTLPEAGGEWEYVISWKGE